MHPAARLAGRPNIPFAAPSGLQSRPARPDKCVRRKGPCRSMSCSHNRSRGRGNKHSLSHLFRSPRLKLRRPRRVTRKRGAPIRRERLVHRQSRCLRSLETHTFQETDVIVHCGARANLSLRSAARSRTEPPLDDLCKPPAFCPTLTVHIPVRCNGF